MSNFDPGMQIDQIVDQGYNDNMYRCPKYHGLVGDDVNSGEKEGQAHGCWSSP